MIAHQTPKQNRILAALPPEDYARLRDKLELVPLKPDSALYEFGSPQGYVYFPTTSVISLQHVMRDGFSAEITAAGNEGLVGTALFMGGESTSSRAMVQSVGFAYRLADILAREEFDRGGPLQDMLLRYTQALITQMAQTVVCYRRHAIDQQLCRWLLLTLDRLPSNEVNMTQERIAHMLGVRREGITEAAGKLQAAGLINYSRGRIIVLDRPRLEAQACECYSVVKRESDRLLSGISDSVRQYS